MPAPGLHIQHLEGRRSCQFSTTFVFDFAVISQQEWSGNLEASTNFGGPIWDHMGPCFLTHGSRFTNADATALRKRQSFVGGVLPQGEDAANIFASR